MSMHCWSTVAEWKIQCQKQLDEKAERLIAEAASHGSQIPNWWFFQKHSLGVIQEGHLLVLLSALARLRGRKSSGSIMPLLLMFLVQKYIDWQYLLKYSGPKLICTIFMLICFYSFKPVVLSFPIYILFSFMYLLLLSQF